LRKEKALLFVNKKKQKNFDFFDSTTAGVPHARSGAKVFCCFFSKKQVFLPSRLKPKRHDRRPIVISRRGRRIIHRRGRIIRRRGIVATLPVAVPMAVVMVMVVPVMAVAIVMVPITMVAIAIMVVPAIRMGGGGNGQTQTNGQGNGA
jgi:hypothetical protein